MQIILKTLIQVLLKNESQKVSGGAIGCFMNVGLESVQTRPTVYVTNALLQPELELVLSLGFLASLANQPFMESPKILHWVEFGDLWRVLLLVAHTGWRARRARLELEVRNEHLQGLARTEFCFVHILHQWMASGKLLITSNFDASFLMHSPPPPPSDTCTVT